MKKTNKKKKKPSPPPTDMPVSEGNGAVNVMPEALSTTLAQPMQASIVFGSASASKEVAALTKSMASEAAESPNSTN